MPGYKNVRLEEHVYNELAKRQLPRESLSQTLERLLNEMDEIMGHLDALSPFYHAYLEYKKGGK